jgi:hypothetical protein
MPREVQALAYLHCRSDQRRIASRRIASQQLQERSNLVGMRQHVVDREHGARMRHTHRVWPPTRILDPLCIEKEQIDATAREARQMCAAVGPVSMVTRRPPVSATASASQAVE